MWLKNSTPRPSGLPEHPEERPARSGRRQRVATAAALVALVTSGAAAGRTHAVQRGDTLEALGRRYGVSVSALARANGIPDVNHIVAGATLAVPAGQSPAVRPATPVRPAGLPTVRVVTKPAAAVHPAGNAGGPGAARPVQVPPARARLRPLFAQFARSAGVPVDLAMALAWQESGWQTNRVSSTDAVGVMQLMPDTVEFTSRILLKLDKNLDPRDPAANIRMGTRFLRYLLDRAGSVDAALASYYQGLRSVRERGPLEETKQFVANVKALRARF